VHDKNTCEIAKVKKRILKLEKERIRNFFPYKDIIIPKQQELKLNQGF